MTLTTGQLEAWMALYLWPFFRIAGCLMVAPIFGASFVPARMRMVLALALTVLVAPMIPVQPTVSPFSAEGLAITVQQVLIGVSLGFVVQLIFDSLAMGGQLLANSMGLSFAFNVDPQRGASTPVLGQFYMILATLVFLALNGHLTLIEMLVDGFRTMPVSTSGFGTEGLWTLTRWGEQIFRGALVVALPGLTALLIVNLAFGVVSRAAPSLNLFAIGFPVTLIFGLLIILVGLPSVQTAFVGMMREAFAMIASLQRAGG
ncbi:MAG: flagellar biosynthetic protein FliR [Steroidobacteraceae bacterium]